LGFDLDFSGLSLEAVFVFCFRGAPGGAGGTAEELDDTALAAFAFILTSFFSVVIRLDSKVQTAKQFFKPQYQIGSAARSSGVFHTRLPVRRSKLTQWSRNFLGRGRLSETIFTHIG
jgi:hypothetical protein